MIAAMGSSSGKTVLTCALLRCLRNQGYRVQGYKCGPDYIDPMYHTRAALVPGRNLDLYLQGEEKLKQTLAKDPNELAILEGAMGFYDGVGGTCEGSAWDIAGITDTPVLLAVRPSGQSITLAAQIHGMLTFRRSSGIAGIFLNDCSPGLYQHLKPVLERETHLKVVGFLPPLEEASFQSRHLGLITAGEVEDFEKRIGKIAQVLERNTDLETVLGLFRETEKEREAEILREKEASVCRIAIARDEAFCFYYQDNLDALVRAGAELIEFSPLRDTHLPKADGLYLGGGYPELYFRELSENRIMRREIKNAVFSGMPAVAECGGFLYLQEKAKDADGREWAMAGVLPGSGFPTGHLQRFGYLTLTARRDSMLFRSGEKVPAHEFHYWDSTDCGTDLKAEKRNGKVWDCAFTGDTLYAGFPHLHWGGSIPMGQRFVQAAAAYREKQRMHSF